MPAASRKPTPHDQAIGRRIKAARRELGYTMKYLGEQTGKTFQQIQKYEAGLSRVPAGILFEVAISLRKPISWFFNDCHYETFNPVENPDDQITAECILLIQSLTGYAIMPSILEMLKAASSAQDSGDTA